MHLLGDKYFPNKKKTLNVTLSIDLFTQINCYDSKLHIEITGQPNFTIFFLSSF